MVRLICFSLFFSLDKLGHGTARARHGPNEKLTTGRKGALIWIFATSFAMAWNGGRVVDGWVGGWSGMRWNVVVVTSV